jgi:Phage-integrase repeat unit
MTYTEEWKRFGDWLGTGTVATQTRTYRAFEEARELVQTLGLKSQRKWKEYCKSGKKPEDIPAAPSHVYKDNWKSWGDWFGRVYCNP